MLHFQKETTFNLKNCTPLPLVIQSTLALVKFRKRCIKHKKVKGMLTLWWRWRRYHGTLKELLGGVSEEEYMRLKEGLRIVRRVLMGALVNLRYFTEANSSPADIFKILEQVPIIESADQKGKTIVEMKADLAFNNIDFAYPSRPGSLVLSKFNLRVMACQIIGLVGGSGWGKSTVINLPERFYDPLEGDILLDGINIKCLQLKWLRSQMGLVDQETVLFTTSIKENIQFGKGDTIDEEIIRAAKAAYAHSFITQLPHGYDTLVRKLGFQISGGQRQRILIAQALLRDPPKILLLDKATSSLDSHSEKAVQDALNHVSLGRTTIIIAHRLSTLRNADLIAVIQCGQVIESGSHDQLTQNKRSAYSTMIEPRHESHKQSWYVVIALFTSGFLTAASAETGSTTVDLSKGINALKSALMILERKSKINPDKQDDIKPKIVDRNIEFREVDFFYPTRPKQMILKSLNLRVDVRQVVTLVGTIHENIQCAKKNATKTEIIEASTFANAHKFIRFATRIAFARAILKNPAILLLDEATSALDIKSENLVQDALEKIMVGRTCLVVAHQLSAVKKSYKISVIKNGRIFKEVLMVNYLRRKGRILLIS
ncbi:hypothetical protein LguiA_009654 [Lonicera macranthoides]